MVGAAENGADSSAFARREQIINAARAVIEEFGPDALTGQIAQRAGLARPNVYRHFASKDELDQAVVSNAYQELRAEIRTRLDLSGTPLDVIRAPLAVQITWADRHPNLYRFLLIRGHQRREAARRNFAADLAAVGEHYFPHFADDRDAAAALVGALGGLIDASILGWLSRRTESRERLTDRLTTQVWLLIDQHLRDIGAHIDPAVPLPQLGPTGS